MKKIPTTLLIMDGYGLAENSERNAIYKAYTPVLDKLFEQCPNSILRASGKDVGLPEGQIGNSEVGHTNIGAGRIVYQTLPLISKAISEGDFFENKALSDLMDECRRTASPLHIMGLLSDGGVHSHNTHIYALLEMAKRRGLKDVYIHAFLDGRDVGPETGAGFLRECCEKTKELEIGKIATVQGRFYAMDRDKRWDRVQRAYEAMVLAQGIQNPDPVKAIEESYAKGITDEFVEPVVCDPAGVIKSGDGVIFANFRPDRAREISYALTSENFDGFERKKLALPVNFVCMTRYDEKLKKLPVAYPPEELEDTFGEYISRLGLSQLRIAETEKYAHVTFFFNGGTETVYEGEDRILVPSPKQFPTYDLIPEMSAFEVADKCSEAIRSGKYDVVICNLANCDMVGHTGNMAAAIKAVETVDICVGRIALAVSEMGGTILITADHGNADCMLTEDGQIHTAHTTQPVPLIICGANVSLKDGCLADIAPTMLEMMGIEKPEKMTGESLITHK
ncbi:MAG: 2,3-bisphosphoglycerate-independent phosphoglycerate mutase [Clostridiales bacterium]|nr:2,3-bisphosphoglycerate-independent phosphoglycerate mutase [Clostridiales bacterium]